MKKRNILIIILIFIIGKTLGQGHPHLNENTTYYISYSSGNDNNDGLTQSSPWKTTQNIEYWFDDIYLRGTKILFKRGDVWNNTGLILKNVHGAQNNPLIIGAYGVGNKPIISGKSKITNTFFPLVDSLGSQIQNLWYCNMNWNPGRIFSNNDNELIKGYNLRFHRTYINSTSGGHENSYNKNQYALGESQYSLKNDCLATMQQPTNKWYWLSNDSYFWYDNCTNCNNNQPSSHPKDSIFIPANTLLLFSISNPNNDTYYKSTNSGDWKSLMNVQILQCSNIFIKDIEFRGGENCFAIGQMGLDVPDSSDLSKNIEIMHCDIGKYSNNGFEIRNVKNIKIHDNIINSNYYIKYGLSETNCKAIKYQQYIGNNSFSYFFSGSDRGTGDAIEISGYSSDCEIYNNLFLNWGHSAVQLATWAYGSVHTRPGWDVSNIKVFNNIINDSLINYGRAFNTYGNKTKNNEFYNNTIINTTIQSQISGTNNVFHHNIFEGVYQSDIRPRGYASAIRVTSPQPNIQCNNNKFDNNTFINCEDGGIKITCLNNDGYLPIHDNFFRNNIFYNCGTHSAALIIQSLSFNINNNKVNHNIYYNNLAFNENRFSNDVFYYNESKSFSIFNNENEGIYHDKIQGNFNDNPNFIDLNLSYKLSNDSPCRNAGDISVILDENGNVLSNLNRFDYYNTTFPNEAPDIGAQEINPKVTRLFENDCNRVLTADNTIIEFYNIFDNTEGYTIKLEDGNHNYLEFFINNNIFDISNYYHTELSNYAFLKPNTWYDVKIKKGNFTSNNYSNYGGHCNIKTPDVTFLSEEYCNGNINIGGYLYCYPLPNAMEYIFKITNSNGTSKWLRNSNPFVEIPNTLFFRESGFYSVKVRDNNSRYGSSCIIKINGKPFFSIIKKDSLSKKYNSNFRILYPIPCEDYLYLKINEKIHIQIFDVSGKMYFNKKLLENHNRINISFLSKGMYIVIMKTNHKVFFEKIIKK